VKSLTSGFGSYELEEKDWRPVAIVVLSICINRKLIPELQLIVNRETAEELGRKIVKQFAQSLPMQDHKVILRLCILF
jgi:translation elongation factor EF-4